MSVATENTEQYKRYLARLKETGYDKLLPLKNPPTDLNKLAKILGAEGMKLLAAEANTPSPPKTLDAALGATDPNPYVRARARVLNDLSEKRRLAIEEMEREKKTDNSEYTKFAQAVALLGDKLSNESN